MWPSREYVLTEMRSCTMPQLLTQLSSAWLPEDLLQMDRYVSSFTQTSSLRVGRQAHVMLCTLQPLDYLLHLQ